MRQTKNIRLFCPTGPLAHLTRLSDREYVDLSKISYIRLPLTFDQGPAFEPARVSDLLITIGGQTGFTPEAEATLRQYLGLPPK